MTLAAREARLRTVTEAAGHSLECFQSNAEHELIERVQRAMQEGIAFILLNPAAFTHTSVALRDALSAARSPFIEIHLSHGMRAPFRRHSYFPEIAQGVISGLGAIGYELALDAALRRLGAEN